MDCELGRNWHILRYCSSICVVEVTKTTRNFRGVRRSQCWQLLHLSFFSVDVTLQLSRFLESNKPRTSAPGLARGVGQCGQRGTVYFAPCVCRHIHTAAATNTTQKRHKDLFYWFFYSCLHPTACIHHTVLFPASRRSSFHFSYRNKCTVSCYFRPPFITFSTGMVFPHTSIHYFLQLHYWP
jgi:hypothetical protein